MAVAGKISFDAFAKWFDTRKKSADADENKVQAPARKKAKGTLGETSLGAKATLTASKRNAFLKSIMTSTKKSIKEKKFYDYGSSNEVNGETVMSPAEFEAVFGAVGTVPSDTKPSKVVTMKELSADDIRVVFGSLAEGITSMTYNKPMQGTFAKQFKMGSVNVSLSGGTLQYSTNTQTCKIKFTAEEGSIPGSYNWDTRGEDY
jgi:hypothetical protein